MRFQLVLVAAVAAVGLAAPNTIEKRLVERFEPPIVPRGCPGGGAGHACPDGLFQCFGQCLECGIVCH